MPSWMSISLIKSDLFGPSSSLWLLRRSRRHSPFEGFSSKMRLTQKYCRSIFLSRSWLITNQDNQNDPHRQPTYSLRLISLDGATHKRSGSPDEATFLGKRPSVAPSLRAKSIKMRLRGWAALAIKPVIPALGPGTADRNLVFNRRLDQIMTGVREILGSPASRLAPHPFGF